MASSSTDPMNYITASGHPHERLGRAEASGSASQVEDSRGGGRPRALVARGRAAEADHRDPQRDAGPSGGSLAGLPEHSDQGQRAPAAVPGVPQD